MCEIVGAISVKGVKHISMIQANSLRKDKRFFKWSGAI